MNEPKRFHLLSIFLFGVFSLCINFRTSNLKHSMMLTSTFIILCIAFLNDEIVPLPMTGKYWQPQQDTFNQTVDMAVSNGSDPGSMAGIFKDLMFHMRLQFKEAEAEESPKSPLYQVLFYFLMFSCLALSFTFSALHLGLMSLDEKELDMLIESGTEREKRYATKILPIRRKGNYLLCTILMGCTVMNATFTTMLDSLVTSVLAVIGTTIAVVLFGEILPQSLGARYGLAIGANANFVTKLALFVFFPVCYPLGKLLDYILGEELDFVRTKENLRALMLATASTVNLKDNEMKIITGALEYNTRRVEDIMTKLENIYMLDIEQTLNEKLVWEILASGHSRVPVYRYARSNIVAVLFTRELAVIDPEDRIPIKRIFPFLQRELYFVPKGTALDVVFRILKTGAKGHMAFVQERNESDGLKQTIGLVTLEDIIEEIVEDEVLDEFDRFKDNTSRRRRRTNQREFIDPAFLKELKKHKVVTRRQSI